MEKWLSKTFWIAILITGSISGIGLSVIYWTIEGMFKPRPVAAEQSQWPTEWNVKKIEVKSQDVNLDAQYLEFPESEWVIMLCHSGQGNLYERRSFMDWCFQNKLGFFAFDYRGYGLSDAVKTTEDSLIDDAFGAFYALLNKIGNPQKIIVYAEQLGAYPAVDLAKRLKISGLIIENGAPGLSELMPDQFRKSLLRGHFSLYPFLSQLQIPTLFITDLNLPDKIVQQSSSLIQKAKLGQSCFIDKEDSQKPYPLNEQWKACMRNFMTKAAEYRFEKKF